MLIERQAVKSIQEGKCLYIYYLNKEQQLSFYWIAIHDIDCKTRKITGTFYNGEKKMKIIDKGYLFFQGIKYAKCLDFASYDVLKALIDKIAKLNEIDKLIQYKDYLDKETYEYLLDRSEKLEKEIQSIPDIKPEDIMRLYVPFNEDAGLQSFFYYASLCCYPSSQGASI